MQESEAVAVPAALATVTNAVEKEEEEEAPPAPEDGALFFADRTRSERIHSRVVREESTKKNAATQAGKCDEAKTGEQDEAGEEAELLASIAKSASKLNAAAGDAEVGLSSDSEGEGDGQRKGPRAAVREAKSEDEDDDESNATTDRVTPAASAPVPTSALAAASESTKEAGKAPRNKRREADVLQAELAALGLTSELKSARTSSGRELRTRNKRGTSELAQQ